LLAFQYGGDDIGRKEGEAEKARDVVMFSEVFAG